VPAAIRQVLSANVATVVVAAGAEGSARIVRELRSRGYRGRVVGTHLMGRRRFAEEAGTAAEGVIFPLLCSRSDLAEGFETAFEARYHVRPDYAAAHTYDGMNLVISAIRRAGLNRARTGDALRANNPTPGVTGIIGWDSLGTNDRPASLGTIVSGRIISREPAQGK
jgi:branched-chain amino acid transport system substrate-binding protein